MRGWLVTGSSAVDLLAGDLVDVPSGGLTDVLAGDLTAGGERQHGASRSSVFYCVELQPDDIHQYSGDLGE